jgi:hypothetical protein
MGCLKKEFITVPAPTMKEVPVPELSTDDPGAYLKIRVLTAGQKDRLDASCSKIDDEGKLTFDWMDYRAKAIIASCCDDDGKLLFTPDDAEFISSLDNVVVDRLYDAFCTVNGIVRTKEEAKKVKEDEPKN